MSGLPIIVPTGKGAGKCCVERKEKMKCRGMCVNPLMATILPSSFPFPVLAATSVLFLDHFLLFCAFPLSVEPPLFFIPHFRPVLRNNYYHFIFPLKIFCKRKALLAL